MRQKPSLDDIVTEAIAEVINNVFEDGTSKIILKFLDENESGTIDQKAKNFASALPEILGSGSVIIEDLILETLYSKLGLEFRWKEDYRFHDYVKELRQTERRENG